MKLKKKFFNYLLNHLNTIGNMKKHPIFEYGIYDELGELIDVVNLTKKQAIEYERDNPTHSIELMEDELDTDDE